MRDSFLLRPLFASACKRNPHIYDTLFGPSRIFNVSNESWHREAVIREDTHPHISYCICYRLFTRENLPRKNAVSLLLDA